MIEFDEKTENGFLCKVCEKMSVATKPTIYNNCPCGGKVEHLNKQLSTKKVIANSSPLVNINI